MLTGVMRGEPEGDDAPRMADRFRAAELLARHYGLLQARDRSAPDPGARRAMAEAVEAEMRALLAEEGDP